MNSAKPIKYIFVSLLIMILTACAPTAPTTSTAMPDTELSSFDEFVAALRAAGATVELAGEVEQPFFPVTGQLVKVNGAEVQVFEFADKATRTTISGTISETGDQVGTSIPMWVDQPHFWATGNLIALYIGRDQATLKDLTQIMGEPITRPGAAASQPPKVVLEAQKWLAKQVKLPLEQVEIMAAEQVEWPDSCLGLGQANESCAQVITPGWRILFQVNGQEHEVRTDETASVVRVAKLTTPKGLAGTQWRLVSITEGGDETSVVKGSNVTLEFETGAKIGGSGGCNSFGGQYQVQGSTLTFSQIVSTEMACAETGLMQQELQFFQTLEGASTFEQTGDRLTITSDDGRELNFVKDSAATR